MAGVGGDVKFLKTEASFKQFIPFNYGDYIFSYGTKLGVISSLEDEKVTSSNRFYFNSNSVRGFDLSAWTIKLLITLPSSGSIFGP